MKNQDVYILNKCKHMWVKRDRNFADNQLFYCKLLEPGNPTPTFFTILETYKMVCPERHTVVSNGECPWIRLKDGLTKCPFYTQN